MFKYTLSQSFRTSLLIQMINLCMLVLSLRPFFSFCLLRSSPPLSLPLSLHFFCFLLPLLSFSFFLILFFLSLKLYSTCFDSRSFSVSDSPSTLSPLILSLSSASPFFKFETFSTADNREPILSSIHLSGNIYFPESNAQFCFVFKECKAETISVTDKWLLNLNTNTDTKFRC